VRFQPATSGGQVNTLNVSSQRRDAKCTAQHWHALRPRFTA